MLMLLTFAMLLLTFLLVLSSICNNFIVEADISVLSAQDSLFTLSDYPLDADQATKKCSSLGGYLAVVADQTINNIIIEAVRNKYPADLQRVWIFKLAQIPLPPKYCYKKSPTVSAPWKSLRNSGEPWYFDLYKTSSPDRVRIEFCRYDWNNWKISVGGSCSGGGWQVNFRLSASLTPSVGHQDVNHYERSDSPNFGSKLTIVNSSVYPFDKVEPTIYAPVSDVFVGARYTNSTKMWHWSDGSVANFTNLSSAVWNNCQQKMLEYGSWKLVDRNCSGFKAHYSCQVRLRASASTSAVTCAGASIKVDWSNNLLKWMKKFPNLEISSLEIGVYLNEIVITNKTALYKELSTTFTNLYPNKTYNIKIRAVFQNKSGILIKTSISVFVPKFPPPEPVTWANVTSNSSCTIEFARRGANKTIVYHITSFTENNTQLSTHNRSLSPNDQHRLTIPGVKQITRFSIKVSTCAGTSKSVPVNGVCFPPVLSTAAQTLQPPTKSTGTPIGGPLAGGLVGIAILILILAFILVRIRRKNADKRRTSQMPFHSGNEPRENAVIPIYSNNLTLQERDHTEISSIPRVAVNQHNVSAFTDCTYVNFSILAISEEDTDITKKELKTVFTEKMKNKRTILTNEFQELKDLSKRLEKSNAVSQLPGNASKNRYKNIYPYDESRVVLQRPDVNDYINAAFIPGYNNSKKFIATQGPRPSTVLDFWYMVWEQHVTVIVMLCQQMENGKRKCEQYWPELGKSKQKEKFQLWTTEERRFGGIIRRKIVISLNEERREIIQFHYTSWPDHGSPATTTNMIYLRTLVDDAYNEEHPVIVHCSAGAGRTGTYIAMDTLFEQLDAEGKVGIKDVVLTMRRHRNDMVQNAEQYAFLHQLVLEHACLPYSDRSSGDIKNLADTEIRAMALREFNQLTDVTKWESSQGKRTKVRVQLNSDQLVPIPDACFIENMEYTIRCIAAKSPLPEEEEKFWAMVIQYQTEFIVALEEKNDFNKIFSMNASENLRCSGGFSIQVSSMDQLECFAIRELTITSANNLNKFSFKHVQIIGWDSKLPPAHFLAKVINQLQDIMPSTSGTMLVYCNNGSNKTGVFVALLNLLERLKNQDKVDVLRTIKDLRDVKPKVIDTEEQYQYCYEVIRFQISAFDTYVNCG